MAKKFSAKHVKVVAFPYSRATLRDTRSDRPGPTVGRFPLVLDKLSRVFQKKVLGSRKTNSIFFFLEGPFRCENFRFRRPQLLEVGRLPGPQGCSQEPVIHVD